MVSLHHKTQFPLNLYIYQSYYTRNQILTFLLYMVQIFGVSTEEFTINEIHIGNNNFPKYEYWWSYFFCLFKFFFQNFPIFTSYYFVDNINCFPVFNTFSGKCLWLTCQVNTNFLKLTCFQENNQKTLYTDVVTLDTYIKTYHKTENTEKHRIQNQA